MPAKYERCVEHVSGSERSRGKSPKEAKRIGHATCTKHDVGGVKAYRKREAKARRKKYPR